MRIQQRTIAWVLAASVLGTGGLALAHASVEGPAFAGKSHILTFGVGHGCEGADTYRVEVQIPASITSVRALPSAWGHATLTKDAAGSVTAVSWSKSESRAQDDHYYQFQLRVSVPDAPFTKLFLPTTQHCRTAEGDELSTAWDALPEEIAAAGEDDEPPPAPWAWIVPPRVPGWNKYETKTKIDDLSVFDDAQIVWVDDAAYSANPETKLLIAAEKDVDELMEIPAGSEIWVRY